MMRSSTLRQLNGGAKDWVVYGMAWEHVAGARPERRSLQRAKAQKATHFIAAHEGSAATGLARLALGLGTAKAGAQRRYISAGVLFASTRPKGVYFGQLDLQEDGIWLIASHDGVVIPGYDVVLDDVARVEEAVSKLNARYADTQRVDITPATSNEAQGVLQARLTLVKSSSQLIPTWMKVAAGVLLAYGLYSEGRSLWDEYQAEQELAQNPAQHFDFNVERAKQLDAWQTKIHVDSPHGLRAVLHHIGKLPLDVGGWLLSTGVSMAAGVSAQTIQCRPDSSGWNCTALYSRTLRGTNESFKQSAPPWCSVGWIDLQKAQLKCHIEVVRGTLDRMATEQADAINLGFIPQVQRVMSAFREVKVDPAVAIPFDSPVVVNQRGDRIILTQNGPENPRAHVPGKQSFAYYGPLRSLTVLPMTSATVIKSIDVQRVDLTDPTLSTSALRAELKGEMYVQ